MRQHLYYSVKALSLIGLVALLGCNSAPPPAREEAPKVSVAHPEKRQLTDHEEFTGWLGADKTVEIRSRVRGHIAKINFTDGEIVPKGKVLFELDPRPFDADIKGAEAKRKIFEAQRVAAEKEEARLTELLAKGGASKKQVEKAEADTKSLVAQIAASEEDVKRAKLDLEYSQIKSEIDGRIGAAKLDVGNLVNAGGSDPLLATVVSVDPIRIYFNIDERSLLRYAKNEGIEGKKNLAELLAQLKDQKAAFVFARDGETEFKNQGILAFADNRIDPTTGTMQIYGTLPNKDGSFVPGARVRVRLTIGKPYEAFLVPETAILSDQDKRYVLIADDKNVVRRRNVTLGALTDDGMRAIQPADKLPEGEKLENWWVLVDNLQRARLNYPIDPQKPGAPASTPAAKTGP
jgi:RND family efflux transporter MFP subunit